MTPKPSLLANRYQLLNLLGAGGMGRVFQAQDWLTGEIVALKQVGTATLGAGSNPQLRLALAREFQVLASLRHPNIIGVRDYGFDSGREPYFSMDLLPKAQTIVTAGQNASPAGKIDLLLQLLHALIYLHHRQIIHRDLKPGNVLVSGRDVKVLDFGLATLNENREGAIGTLAYMAPELLQGHPAGPASDLYAVGLLGYELFAGWFPYPTSPSQLIQSILHEQPNWDYVAIAPELRAVFQQLLAKDPAGRPPNADAVVVALSQATGRALPLETQATRESFIQAAPFTGRDNELNQLSQALQAAQQGQGQSWRVGGESGVGKSRLLQELRTLAMVQGAIVLHGQASENGPAYQSWLPILRRLLLLAEPTAEEAAILKPLVTDIERLLFRPVADPPPLQPQQARPRLLATVSTLLQRAAGRQPLLLILEDVHWAGDNSLELLQWLNRQISQMAVLIVASYRDDEAPQLASKLAEMALLALPRLSLNQIAHLSRAMLGPAGQLPHLVTFLSQETEGNTLFVVEVMRALAETAGRLERIAEMTLPKHILAGGMMTILQRRLGHIPAGYTPLTQLAAVSGRVLDLAVLGQASDQATNLDNWLTIGANAAVFTVQDGRWQFAHDKLRQAALLNLPPHQRQQLHGQIGQAIEQLYVDQLSDHYPDLAHHYQQAQQQEKARHYTRLAGESAQAAFANAEAIAYYEQLLNLLDADDLPGRADTWLKLSHLFRYQGQMDKAKAGYQQIISQPALPLPFLARAYLGLGGSYRAQSNYAQALDWLEKARQSYSALHDPAGLADTLSEIGAVLYYRGDYGAAGREMSHCLTIAQTLNDQQRTAQAYQQLGNIAFDMGDYATTRAHYQASLEIRRHLGDKNGLAASLSNLAVLALYEGNFAYGLELGQQSLAIRRETGDKGGQAIGLNNLGILAKELGDFALAERYYQEGLSLHRAFNDKQGIAGNMVNLGVLAFLQGYYGQAQQLYEAALVMRREIGDRWGIASSLIYVGDMALLAGRWPEADATYRESLILLRELGDKQKIAYAFIGLAGARIGQGHPAGITLLAGAEKLLQNNNLVMESHVRIMFDFGRKEALSRPELPFDSYWSAGQTLSLEEAFNLALPAPPH